MRTIANEVKTQYFKIGKLLRRWFAQIFHFENINSFISPRGFFVSFFVLLLLAGVAKARVPIDRCALAATARPDRGCGLARRPEPCSIGGSHKCFPSSNSSGCRPKLRASSPRRAQAFIASRGPERDSVSGVPRQVVDAFYQIRFGHLELEPDTLEAINDGLDALELRLKSP